MKVHCKTNLDVWNETWPGDIKMDDTLRYDGGTGEQIKDDIDQHEAEFVKNQIQEDIPTFITEKPDFAELVELHNNAYELKQLVISLAEGNDTTQRAFDLFDSAKQFVELVSQIVVEENDD